MPIPGFFTMAANRAIVLKNATCVYCGSEHNPQIRTKEHVIGRRFVPKGALDGWWNLIAFACRACNSMKSDLEDDLSALTMQPTPFGTHPIDDDRLRAESTRKGRSVSRRTGKPVAASRETIEVKMPFGPGSNFTFTMVASPQVDPQRAFELARLQLMGFFYFLTYNEEHGRGNFWPHTFSPFAIAPRSDWGNAHFVAFAEAVSEWGPRLVVRTADGYFAVAIRRHPNAETWSWALEWNMGYRLIGFFGAREPAQAIVDAFPPLPTHTGHEDASGGWRVRTEVALPEGEDHLFSWPDSDGPLKV